MRRIQVGDFRLLEAERQAIMEVLERGRLSEGKKVQEFESRFADYIGTKYCVALNSGTSALIATLLALKSHSRFRKMRGKKVITTPLTYIATCNAIVLSGFEPVFADVHPKTFGITPSGVQALIDSSPDPEEYLAILPVHLMGFPCDMGGLGAIARKYGLFLLEDSAQAHGSLWEGQTTGSIGDSGAFSFYIAHNIQAGEMGAATTSDEELMLLLRKLKANGRVCDCRQCRRIEGLCPRADLSDGPEDLDPRFTHELIGYNFKLMEFQAALGLSQLRKADEIFQRRLHNVRYLSEHLAPLSELIQLPPFLEEVSYLAYPVVIKVPELLPRKRVRMALEAQGIETRPLFGCIPTQQPAYGHLAERYRGTLPHAEYLGRNAFYVGCHQYLEQEDLDYMVEAFHRILIPILEGEPALKREALAHCTNPRRGVVHTGGKGS